MTATKQTSARQRLRVFVETGRLRDALHYGRADEEVADLVVDLCLRYCEPHRRRRTWRKSA